MRRRRATYRLQLHAGFDFAAAAAAIPYLTSLGISHLYLSPVLQAAKGSTHGYDVVDPDRVADALGGETGFRALIEAAHVAGLGILLDIVPNHMSIAGTGNRWWLDVLENGPASYYAHYFDVDWQSGGDDRVLLPVLGERYGRALTSGLITVVHKGGGFEIRVHDLRLPVAPRSLGTIVRRAGDRIDHAELQFIGDSLAALPSPHDRDLAARRRRHRDKAVLLGRLVELCGGSSREHAALDAELAAINTDLVELDAILEAQNYRLAHWTVAGSQLSYRRFFDITTLVGLRNEEPDVLEASHRRIFEWLADGSIDGVRVDHVDGLRMPTTYLRTLRERAPDAWIVVEKILGAGERLPEAWPIDGTTGYDFMERMNQLFVDGSAEPQLTATFTAYTGLAWDPPVESRKARLEVMTDALHSELARLTELAVRACAASPAYRDYTRAEIETTLAEILAGYPVYRTYLGEDTTSHSEDRARIARAAAAAVIARPELDRDLLQFLDSSLAFELPSTEARDLALAAQQTSSPIVAKGDEDTLLYRQVRLLVRCDVGAELAKLACDPNELHHDLSHGSPSSLLATSTHDSKRSEDVRTRIAVISELPQAWDETVRRWGARAEHGWGDRQPDRVLEYATWQTLVGAWPLPVERLLKWVEKASREARFHTSWRRPDAAYEAAAQRWIEGIYQDTDLLGEIERFAATLAPHGDRNSLAQTLIKLTAPGIPDFYQGTELRDDSLVDPDNRRAVDLSARERMLRELGAAELEQLGALPKNLGAAKLWMIRRVLELRTTEHAIFEGTAYRPLAAVGAHAHRVFSFMRGEGRARAITVVPRLGANADDWRDTTLALPHGAWRDALSGQTHTGSAPIAELWRAFPVALLISLA